MLGQYHDCAVVMRRFHIGHQLINDQFLEAFAQEAALSHKIGSHPRIVDFVGACVTPPELCMVYRYMPFGDLDTILLKQRRFASSRYEDARVVLQMATDTAQGLAFLHAKGVIHRRICCRHLLMNHEMRVR